MMDVMIRGYRAFNPPLASTLDSHQGSTGCLMVEAHLVRLSLVSSAVCDHWRTDCELDSPNINRLES
jgi:hypothetical protein